MVEIGTGEVIYGSPKPDVTLLADVEQLVAVEVRSAPGWGNSSSHVHARHAEALCVLEGEVTLGLGDNVTNLPERRATVLVEADELTISEFDYGPGERGAPRHVHREHADAFLVLEGEFTFHLRDGSQALPAGTLVAFPPGVVHGFDNDSNAFTRAFNFHMPSFGFADYMRGKNSAFDQFDPPEDGGIDPAAVVVARLSH